MAAIGRYGWQTAMRQIGYGDTSQTLGLPIALYWTPLLAGCALAVLATVVIALAEGAGNRHRPAPGAAARPRSGTLRIGPRMPCRTP